MDIVCVGKILHPFGLNGMVVVRAFADPPRNLKTGVTVRLEPEDAEFSLVTIESVAQHKKVFRIRFKEITRRTQAERLKARNIVLLKDFLEPLPGNEYYVFELVGCNVRTVSGESHGHVEDVISNPGNDLLRVSNKTNSFLIPLVKEFIKEIDLDKREIVIEPIEGLIEIN